MLILDDFEIQPMEAQSRINLLDIIEDRHVVYQAVIIEPKYESLKINKNLEKIFIFAKNIRITSTILFFDEIFDVFLSFQAEN